MFTLTLVVSVQNFLVVSVRPEQLMWVNKKRFGVSTPFENPQRKFLPDTQQTQTANLNYTTQDIAASKATI